MSDLQRLKGQLEGIASDARKTSGNLAGFKKNFSSAVSQIESSIGGSAQRADQQIIQILQAAEKQVDAAIQALQEAATSSQRFGSSL